MIQPRNPAAEQLDKLLTATERLFEPRERWLRSLAELPVIVDDALSDETFRLVVSPELYAKILAAFGTDVWNCPSCRRVYPPGHVCLRCGYDPDLSVKTEQPEASA